MYLDKAKGPVCIWGSFDWFALMFTTVASSPYALTLCPDIMLLCEEQCSDKFLNGQAQTIKIQIEWASSQHSLTMNLNLIWPKF